MGTMTGVETEQTLVMATSHVTPETAAILNALDHAGRLALPWGPFAVYDEGWIFWVPFTSEEEIADYPPEFVAIFALARTCGCKLVRLDCDACVNPNLPHWEW